MHNVVTTAAPIRTSSERVLANIFSTNRATAVLMDSVGNFKKVTVLTLDGCELSAEGVSVDEALANYQVAHLGDT